MILAIENFTVPTAGRLVWDSSAGDLLSQLREAKFAAYDACNLAYKLAHDGNQSRWREAHDIADWYLELFGRLKRMLRALINHPFPVTVSVDSAWDNSEGRISDHRTLETSCAT